MQSEQTAHGSLHGPSQLATEICYLGEEIPQVVGIFIHTDINLQRRVKEMGIDIIIFKVT